MNPCFCHIRPLWFRPNTLLITRLHDIVSRPIFRVIFIICCVSSHSMFSSHTVTSTHRRWFTQRNGHHFATTNQTLGTKESHELWLHTRSNQVICIFFMHNEVLFFNLMIFMVFLGISSACLILSVTVVTFLPYILTHYVVAELHIEFYSVRIEIFPCPKAVISNQV